MKDLVVLLIIETVHQEFTFETTHSETLSH